jgi:TonB family protein
VVVHAVLLGWVGWQVVVPLRSDTQAGGQLMLLPPSFFDGSGLEGRSTPRALEEVEAPEVEPTESGGLDGTEVGGAGDDEVMDRWAAAADRLGYRGLFRAEVVEPAPDQAAAVEGEGEPDSLSIGGLNAAAFAELSHGDSLDLRLDLDRLTELRPELAVMIPSMWILLRNPTAVETFLRRSSGRWTLDPNEPGSVTVTVWIDTKGSVEWAEVSRSSGRGDLDEAALALFNEVVTFRPARHEGVSVSGSATFALLFPW